MIYTIKINEIDGKAPEKGLSALRIIEGCEEMSSLYRYEVLIRDTSDEGDREAKMRGYLGKRVLLGVTCAKGRVDNDSGEEVQRIVGVVMSIESTTENTTLSENAAWYKWTIRPSLSRACYSKNRLVYTRESLGLSADTNQDKKQGKDTYPLDELFRSIGASWDTEVELTDNAKQRLAQDAQVQWVQNDESDYDFMSRLASMWGLAYVWEVPKDAKKERMVVFDALSESDSRLQKETPVQIGIAAAKTRFWSEHYGVQNFADKEVKVQLYSDSQQLTSPVKYSSYEQGNVLLNDLGDDKEIFLRELALRLAHDNRGGCFGLYYHDYDESGKLPDLPVLGREMHFKVADKKDGGLQCSPSTRYMLTKMRIQVTQNTWQAEMEGAYIDEARQTKCSCPLPRPVIVNNTPTGTADMLVPGEAWDAPKMRLFIAQVTDTTPWLQNQNVDASNIENTCKVREIAPLEYTGGDQRKVSFSNELVVELGSPFADRDSGLLARPRIGNVLICLDRGDFSLPVAISSLYRGDNKAPYAELKTMERHKLEEQGDVADYSAVTLRNRVQLPPRKYQGETKESPAQDADITDAEKNSDPAGLTRPLSVDELAEGKYPFHQIQMITRDNGVRPVLQNKDITNTYISSDVIETAAGVFSEANMSSGYTMESVANDIQQNLNAPVTRPHFEGVNVYSAKDVLIQSADHQIVNAGGEIVLTSAQAITFRVGRSSIKITESGIEMTSACGKVLNSGAYAAYNPEGKQQTEHLMGIKTGGLLGGRIRIDGSGVNIKGPYISNIATNVFMAQTFLGSSFTVTDLSASLLAPKTTIVGGAAVQDAAFNTVVNLACSGFDAKSLIGTSFIYSDELQDGNRVYGLSSIDLLGSAASGIIKTITTVTGLVGNIMDGNLTNLVQPTGSMVKMEPSTLTLSSPTYLNYANEHVTVNTPIAGFVAMGERSSVSGGMRTFGNLTSNADRVASGIVGVGVTAVAGGVGTMIGATLQDKFGKRNEPTDTYTEPFGNKKPKMKCRDSKVATEPMTIIGGVGLAVGGAVLAGLLLGLKGITKVLEGLSNLLFLGKKHTIVGNTTVQQLNEEVTAVGREQSLLSANNQMVTNNNTTATQNNTTANTNGNSLQYQTQIIHRVGNFVSDTNSTVTLDNTNACETIVSAQANRTSGANTNNSGLHTQN